MLAAVCACREDTPVPTGAGRMTESLNSSVEIVGGGVNEGGVLIWILKRSKKD
jgi:hypothetical protein